MEKLINLRKFRNKNKSTPNILIEKARNGDKEAFEELIGQYKEYLYKMSFLYMKNEHDAMDIYQETIYKAILNIDKLQNIDYFKTWITRILINNVNSIYRNNNRFKDNFEELDQVEDTSYEELENKMDLYSAIDILDEKYKTPIILQYFQDMTIKEISNILECNENTIKTYLRRGKDKLHKVLMEGN